MRRRLSVLLAALAAAVAMLQAPCLPDPGSAQVTPESRWDSWLDQVRLNRLGEFLPQAGDDRE